MDFGMNLVTWLGFLAITGLLYEVWRWAGTAIPPASMIDEKLMGLPVEQTSPPTAPVAPDNSSDTKYVETVRIASDKMYLGPPFLETVRVRVWAIELFIGALAMVVLAGLGVGRIQAVSETILAHPSISTLVALMLFVPALLVGAIRQGFGYMLSHAGAIPVIDGFGRPRFSYIGDVPPARWQHSPWFRAITWIPVAGGSLIGAWIGSLFVNQFLDFGLPYAFSAFLSLRWLISAIPVLLYRSTIVGEA